MTGSIRSFRDLIAWQKAMDLCEEVYQVSRRFPDTERFGLVAQIRRAAVSVPSNIAEGYGRNRQRDYVRFLEVARGSLCEVETQLLLARRLALASDQEVAAVVALAHEVERIISALARAVRDSAPLA